MGLTKKKKTEFNIILYRYLRRYFNAYINIYEGHPDILYFYIGILFIIIPTIVFYCSFTHPFPEFLRDKMFDEIKRGFGHLRYVYEMNFLDPHRFRVLKFNRISL